MCVPDEFEKYCSDVEHTAAWGGQLEVSCESFATDTLRLRLVLLNNCFPLHVFSSPVARFDPSSSLADRSDPGRLPNYKDRGGI